MTDKILIDKEEQVAMKMLDSLGEIPVDRRDSFLNDFCEYANQSHKSSTGARVETIEENVSPDDPFMVALSKLVEMRFGDCRAIRSLIVRPSTVIRVVYAGEKEGE